MQNCQNNRNKKHKKRISSQAGSYLAMPPLPVRLSLLLIPVSLAIVIEKSSTAPLASNDLDGGSPVSHRSQLAHAASRPAPHNPLASSRLISSLLSRVLKIDASHAPEDVALRDHARAPKNETATRKSIDQSFPEDGRISSPCGVGGEVRRRLGDKNSISKRWLRDAFSRIF